MLSAHLIDVPGREPRMHRAVALPEDDARLLDGVGLEATPDLVRIPHHHLIEGHAHFVGGVAAKMLVGQEENLLASVPCPLQRRRRIRRGADHAAMLAAEGLNRRGGVDVGDGNDGGVAEHLLQIGPALFELIRRGHVGHRTAGGEIGQDHLLVRAAQDVGTLGHEVHAAKHDELGVGMLAHLAGKLVGIADVVGELDHFVALIVVTEDHQAAAEGRFGRGNAAVHFLVGKAEIAFGQRLPLGNIRLLVVGQQRDQHRRLLDITR